jgi:hypothetical protein
MDIKTLVQRMIDEGKFRQITNNPLAQFGTPQKTYHFARLLPDRQVKENTFREDRIRYRTVVANDSTRYSPVQIKGNIITGSFLVELGNSDIGSEMTARDYDAFLDLVRAASGDASEALTMEAVARLTAWADATLNLPLVEKRELQRAQALCDAVVTRKGDNGYEEEVQLSNPSGHRVETGAGDWDDPDYPIYDDVLAGIELLASKGYTANGIMTTTPIRAKMSKNNDIKERAGKIVVDADGSLKAARGRASLEQINEALRADGLPAMTINDTQFATQTESGFFMPRTDFLITASTGREETIDLGGDEEPLILTDTLGYTAQGKAAGQPAPGVKTLVTPFENKPPRIEGEAWQTSFPVPTEPEAVYRIRVVAA